MVNTFQGGYNGTVYTCFNCKRRTRETGDGESTCQLCKRCYEEAGYENEHSDKGSHDYKGFFGNNVVLELAATEYAKAHCPTCIGKEWWQ